MVLVSRADWLGCSHKGTCCVNPGILISDSQYLTQSDSMDTPSPELKKTPFSRFATPNGLGCRKMTSSPANFPNKRLTDFNELSMSPLHLMDSPSVRLPAPLTPSTSYAESPRKSPRVLKQTSTPSDRMALTDTPSLKNKAFIISSSSVPSKAKRRLIEDGESTKNKVVLNSSIRDSSFQGNAPKRQKTTPKSAPSLGRRPLKLKKRVGQINFGVSHRIRPKEKPDKLIKRSFGITLSDLKKNRNSDVPRHPFDPVNKSINETHEDVQSQQAQVTEIIQPHPENKMPPIISDSISPLIKGMQRAKLQSPTVAITKEKTPRISPKVITRNWNQRYKTDNRERKFFKSRQSNEDTPNRVVTVSVSENLKLQVHEKSLGPLKNDAKSKSFQIGVASCDFFNRSSSASRLSESEDNSKDSLLFSSIRTEPNSATQNSLHNSYHMLQQDWDEDTADIDLSCNIQNILDELNEDEAKSDDTFLASDDKENIEDKENVEAKKLFPLFYKDSAKSSASNQESPTSKKPSQKSTWIKAKHDGESQMILDAGQKEYGTRQCPECSMVYHLKDPEDELLHQKIHDSLKDSLRFLGWKKERVVRRFDADSHVISVHYGDAPHCWKKVHSVLSEVVDKELGFSEVGIRNPQSSKVYLYITDKKIAGVLVAENISRGYRVLPDSTSSNKCCSPTPLPVLCGINRIWTLASYRRHKVATKLLDAMRSEFIYGKVLTVDEVAFSHPTEIGLAFATSYSKRPDFLVYNW